MSIIGTRPPLISETNLYELHHRARLKEAIRNIHGTITELELSDTELEEDVVSIPADPDVKNA